MLAAALVAAPVVGLTARGGESQEANKPKPEASVDDASVDPKNAREILRALRELHDSVGKEGEAPTSHKGASASHAPHRPDKTVKTPTIDSAALDAMLEKSLTEAKAPTARVTTDEEFVRRAYLDVTGKLPTTEQMAMFLHDHEKKRRAKLIDHLLDSHEYATNWAHYWRDVIRFHAANTNVGQVRYPEMEEWLAEQFHKNRPWDEIASDLITATGRNDENGAAVFTIAQMGQPVEMAGEVSRVFMGVQIQCAQCHDHPNDPWKREQFHQFAAFFAGIRTRRANNGGMAKAEIKKAKAEVKESGKAKGKEQAKAKGANAGPPAFEVIDQPGKPRYSMPDLKDPQKQTPVAPRFFLASKGETVPDGLTAAQRRSLVASYVTAQDNPWFAKAFVNRVWYALMGEGFYNPVDDLGPTRSPNNPEVLDALATEWQQGGYDVKWLFRTILNTKTYQRESRATSSAAGRVPFASNCPSRLRSDQIVDALAHALNLPLNGNGGGGAMGKNAIKKAAAGTPKAFQNNGRTLLNVLFGVDPSTPNDDVLGTIPQALFLMNSPQVNRAIQANNGTVLGDILSATPDNREALESLYLRVLARRPNAREVSICGRYLETIGNRREGFEDILWSLINSTEFVSRR
jgi:hypothetical protein